MRFEDKEVDDHDVEHSVELERNNELEKDDELEVPDLDVSTLLDGKRENLVIGAMRAILEHRQIIVNDLRLPQAELRALEALKAAVEGKDGDLAQFVYASDRSDLLEQALAILQPSLIEDLDEPFADLVERIGNLRGNLKDLDDAQDELLSSHHKEQHAKADGDTDDKPKPPQGDASLDGPERPVVKTPSTLDGPEVKLVEQPTTLIGADAREPPKGPSTLDGMALKDVEPPPTSLGSPEDLKSAEPAVKEPQKQKTKPWWKRPFGG